ncbi:MAG: hypothetical protein LC725_04670, partial [Lentisphaerae bacterium]|nr:hypothetical protein [Lentisphaerota bacterium]
LFLNGACGNIMHKDYTDLQKDLSMERVGGLLAENVAGILANIRYTPEPSVAVSEKCIKIKFRGMDKIREMAANIDKPDYYINIFGNIHKLGWYHYSLQRLQEMTAQADGIEVVIQVIRLGDIFFAAIPAEYFTEHGLRIKEQSPAQTCVVSLANGWLGYIPTRAAFRRRGGHETSLAFWSKMEKDAGDRMADLALAQIRSLHHLN